MITNGENRQQVRECSNWGEPYTVNKNSTSAPLYTDMCNSVLALSASSEELKHQNRMTITEDGQCRHAEAFLLVQCFQVTESKAVQWWQNRVNVHHNGKSNLVVNGSIYSVRYFAKEYNTFSCFSYLYRHWIILSPPCSEDASFSSPCPGGSSLYLSQHYCRNSPQPELSMFHPSICTSPILSQIYWLRGVRNVQITVYQLHLTNPHAVAFHCWALI